MRVLRSRTKATAARIDLDPRSRPSPTAACRIISALVRRAAAYSTHDGLLMEGVRSRPLNRRAAGTDEQPVLGVVTASADRALRRLGAAANKVVRRLHGGWKPATFDRGAALSGLVESEPRTAMRPLARSLSRFQRSFGRGRPMLPV